MADTGHSEFYGIKALNAVDALSIGAGASKLKEMQSLLDDGVDINGIAVYSRMTALCSASRLGATKAVAFLIERGAEVDRPSEGGATPLMYACSLGNKKGLEICRQLITAGADVNYAISGEVTALTSAAEQPNADIVQFLIDSGADIDGPPGTSQTALMLAARSGDVPTIKVLVENGADRSLTCKLPWAQNRTAQGLAELEGRREAVAYFKSLEGQ